MIWRDIDLTANNQVRDMKKSRATFSLVIIQFIVLPGIIFAQFRDDSSQLNLHSKYFQKETLYYNRLYIHQSFIRNNSNIRDGIAYMKHSESSFVNDGLHTNTTHIQTAVNSTTDADSKPSILVEIGYILAMETVFTGMSYLASRRKRTGPIIAGGFDLLMCLAGLPNASIQGSAVQKTGHYLITAGFFTKSLYNFHFGKEHSQKTRFITNFIGFNVLVFSGYYLDTLN